MAYSHESLVKYNRKMSAAIAYWMSIALELIHVSISKGNRKIGRVLNVSLPAIRTCANCSGCLHICYDIKACLQYMNVIMARAKNLVLLTRDRNRYFAEIDDAMTRRKTNKYMRFHVSGDIIDIDYLDRMVQLARKHADFMVWTYTKNYSVVNEYIRTHGGNRFSAFPSNLVIMMSEWRGMPMDNPYKLPEFRVVFKDDTVKPIGYYCPGNCDICKEHKCGCIGGMTVYCNEH